MWTFVTSKKNPNVSLLLGLPSLQSVDAKLFIQKKEIHIEYTKKGETVSQTCCSITVSEGTQFQASKNKKIVVDKLSEEKDIDNNIGDSSFSEESNEEPSDRDL